MYRTCREEDEFLSSSREEDEEVGWTPPVIIPSRQEEEFLSSLRERDDHVVCIGEEEEAERKELLVRSMARPLLSPPAHGYPDNQDGLPRPDFVLLEQQAYFIDRDNATTASCNARAPVKGKIKVTFCVAPPPLVSYFCVHATAYTHTDFVTDPIILASETDDGLVLLGLIIGKSKSDFFQPRCLHFFVYDSGTRGSRPSLKHLPHPGGTFGGNYHFNGPSLAILRHCNPDAANQQEHDCSESDYVIIARDCMFGYKSPSYLCLYQSVTDCWSFKPVQVPTAYHGHITSKTLTIGEKVAWVDLSRDVIFCDVLAETPKFRFVVLPPPINEVTDPRSVRDIVILDGCINYVEVHQQINDGIIDGWMAAKWSMKITSHSEEWHMDYKVYSSDILVSSKFEGNTTQPNLQRLHIGLPNLSLQDKNIVYLLAKIHFCDSEQTSWVIAVDFKNNKIHEAVEYNAIKTVGLSIGYNASRISKYLRGALGVLV